MNISEIIPELALKSFLEGNDVTGVYPAGIPISGVPSEFFTISMNGSIVSESEDASVLGCTLMLGVYVKLLTTNGTVNQVREKILMRKFSELFPATYNYEDVTYKFSLDFRNLVYSGRNLYSGYSTKALNLQVTIY